MNFYFHVEFIFVHELLSEWRLSAPELTGTDFCEHECVCKITYQQMVYEMNTGLIRLIVNFFISFTDLTLTQFQSYSNINAYI